MYNQIYITGFKKFGNIDVNPTQLIIDQLTTNPISNVIPNKLDVTVNEVDLYIQKIKHQQKCKQNKKILNLHCGVGPNKVYFLQHCAYNNKDFRIPDNNGTQCKNQKICLSKQLDQAFFTCLNLEHIIEKLQQKHQITISKNPGRYLCNYVYYCSLNSLKCQQQNIDSLFVHFPNLSTKNEEQNITFIKDLIGVLLLKSKEK